MRKGGKTMSKVRSDRVRLSPIFAITVLILCRNSFVVPEWFRMDFCREGLIQDKLDYRGVLDV